MHQTTKSRRVALGWEFSTKARYALKTDLKQSVWTEPIMEERLGRF